MNELEIRPEHIEQFERDGFIVFEEFLDPDEVDRVKLHFEPLFHGQWETGLAPDEVNWQYGRDRDDRTRQLCNAWKADYAVADVVLRPTIGRIAAELSRWEGTRLHLDNIIWKPPGASGLTMHQDGSYGHYMVPNAMTSLWMALTDTSADAGTVLYVRGSHRWGETPKPDTFIVDDHLTPMLQAARQASMIRKSSLSKFRRAAWPYTQPGYGTAPAPTPPTCRGRPSSRTARRPPPASTPRTRRTSVRATGAMPTPRWTRVSSPSSGRATVTVRRG